MALLTMPKLGLTMEEGRISEWKVAPGVRFAKGEIIVIIETDKIASEIEAPSDGHIVAFTANEGDVVVVGEAIANWTPAGLQDDPCELASTDKTSAAQTVDVEPGSGAGKPRENSETRIVATPLARRRARELGIELQTLTGSGPRGRIKESDVLAAPATVMHSSTIAPEMIEISPATEPATAWQRAAAQSMIRSKTTIPHFYLSTEIDIAPVETAIRKLRSVAGERRITATSIFLFAMGRALARLPHTNRVWVGDALRPIGETNVGLAIATPQGLAAPIIRNCTATIWDIAERVDATINRANGDRLTSADMDTPAAITLSNAGMHDITQMISIIPPMQSAILGVGSTRATFRPDPGGRPMAVREVVLSLSCDHRVFDGVTGIALLDAIRSTLSDPLAALLTPVERTS